MDLDTPPSSPPSLSMPEHPKAIQSEPSQFEAIMSFLKRLEARITGLEDKIDRLVLLSDVPSVKREEAVEGSPAPQTEQQVPQSHFTPVVAEDGTASGSGPTESPLLRETDMHHPESLETSGKVSPERRGDLQERIGLGIIRPEELVFLTDVQEGAVPADRTLMDDLLQEPSPQNRKKRRDAFCCFFIPERFYSAWTKYVGRVEAAHSALGKRLPGDSNTHLVWISTRARKYHWEDVMGLHFDVHEDQASSRILPGSWTMTDKVSELFQSGDSRLRAKLQHRHMSRRPGQGSHE